MDKIKSIIRIFILLTIALIAFVGIFGIPDDEMSQLAWWIIMITSKLTGIASVVLLLKLYVYYTETDKWISKIDNWWCPKKEDDYYQ